MTSVEPLDRHDHFESDDDRLAYLFAVACDEEAAPRLSQRDQADISRIKQLLDTIDASWEAPLGQVERVEMLFFQKLAAKYPDHPWVQVSTVKTLGELARAEGNSLLLLPSHLRDALLQDSTPLATLMNPETRTAAIGRFVQSAKVPADIVTTFINWLQCSLATLVPDSSSSAGVVFTRKQSSNKPSSPKTNEDESAGEESAS